MWGDPIELKDDGLGGFFASIRERLITLGFGQSAKVTFNGVMRDFVAAVSPDASTFKELAWALPSGSMWILLGSSTDFAHYALAHNIVMDPTSGLFTSTADSTSTSYVLMLTDSGLLNVYQAPATGVVGAAPTFGATPTFSLNLLTGALNSLGVVDGSTAAAGMVGEVRTAAAAPATTGLTSTTPINVASVTLTPGDWDVSASYVIEGTGSTTFTLAQAGLSFTSATLPADNLINTRNSSTFTTPPTAIYAAAEVPMQRVSVSVSTVVYLVASATFAVSTAGAGGVITARRAR